MTNYRVSIPYVVYVHADVEADNEDDAIEAAFDNGAGLTQFAGNGGSDKLVGVYGSDMFVEACDVPLETEEFSVTAEEMS